MAYSLTGDVKKGVKLKYADGSDNGSSRTYNGLNITTDSTAVSGAENGVYIGNVADLFALIFNQCSTVTVTSVLYNTEEVLENG